MIIAELIVTISVAIVIAVTDEEEEIEFPIHYVVMYHN